MGNTIRTRTQADRILCFLCTRRPLTPQRALRSFGTMRLAARIKDLREQGHDIKTRIVERRGMRFAEYRLS